MENLEGLYKILNLNISATKSDIKKAYYKLAKEYHPDKLNYGKEEAEELFDEIKKAYDVLMDDDLVEQLKQGTPLSELKTRDERVNEIIEGVLLSVVTGRFVGDYEDLIKRMDAELNETRLRTKDAIETTDSRIHSLQAIHDRIVKGEVLKIAINKEISFEENNLKRFNSNLEDLNKASDMLTKFEYSTDIDEDNSYLQEEEEYAQEYLSGPN